MIFFRNILLHFSKYVLGESAKFSTNFVFIFLQESCYQPPVEAISPTGPEAPGDQMDDLKAVKDELLTKITKVDREIAKTESQIAKLKKKYVSYFYSIPFVNYIFITYCL